MKKNVIGIDFGTSLSLFILFLSYPRKSERKVLP